MNFILFVIGFVVLVSFFNTLVNPSNNNKRTKKNNVYVNISCEPKPMQRGFTDEEILALGLYPDDEAYKMALISKIINK